MTEARTVEPRTLCFIGNGTFKLLSWGYGKSESRWRNTDGSQAKEGDLKEREKYISSIHLELASPSGAVFLSNIPKREIIYAMLEALFITSPPKALAFSWSPTEKKVIVSEALA